MRASVVLLFVVVAVVVCQTPPPSGNPPPCAAVEVKIEGSVGNATLFGYTIGQPHYARGKCNPDSNSGVSWFTITPPAGKNVDVSTCGEYTNFDTHIGIFTGTCDNLTCIIANDDGDCPYFGGSSFYTTFFTTFSSFTSFTSFNAEPEPRQAEIQANTYPDPSTVRWIADGSQYFIAVTGNNGQQGNFDLTVVVGESLSGCPTAKELPGPYTTRMVVNGTLRDDETVGVGACHNFRYDNRGVWFKIFPELNKQMNVSTCSPGTNFDTRLAILSGSSCSNLECDFENDDDNCQNPYESSTIDFLPVESSYYVLVTSFGYETVANFQLVLSQSQYVENINCANAYPYHVGYAGNPEGSTATQGKQLSSSTCGGETGLAVWFRIISSTTSSVTFSTCNSATDFDTVLSIYGGTCSQLHCVAQNDDYCSTGSQVTVQMQANTAMYLVLSGKNGATGNYEITSSFQ